MREERRTELRQGYGYGIVRMSEKSSARGTDPMLLDALDGTGGVPGGRTDGRMSVFAYYGI